MADSGPTRIVARGTAGTEPEIVRNTISHAQKSSLRGVMVLLRDGIMACDEAARLRESIRLGSADPYSMKASRRSRYALARAEHAFYDASFDLEVIMKRKTRRRMPDEFYEHISKLAEATHGVAKYIRREMLSPSDVTSKEEYL